ncbi:ATP-binding cassette domain-containing protein [Euzebya sp.]|uniref:ABC transporter ATP-binding protein n=1 Tax=Euzebya sp. TaxID=1971409 RepID=UPI003517EEBC
MRQRLPDTLPIRAEGLVKRFGDVTALDGLDLEVRHGEVHGFLGPNGAGKSTTIRAILGHLRLDRGRAQVFGLDPWTDAVTIHGRLAYVPGDVALWPSLTGGECIDLLGSLQGSQDRDRRDELVDRFRLDPTRRTRTYSKGNRQKVALVAALATDAELLVLDEPTAGLDPLMESVFQQCIREAVAEGRTVLLSSHILGEVEALCDRVTILRDGRAVRTGTLAELAQDAGTTVTVITPEPMPGLAEVDGVEVLESTPGADGVRTVARVGGASLAGAVSVIGGAAPTHLVVEPPSLDELFLQHYSQAAEGVRR